MYSLLFAKLDFALSITMHLLRDASLFLHIGRVNSDLYYKFFLTIVLLKLGEWFQIVT